VPSLAETSWTQGEGCNGYCAKNRPSNKTLTSISTGRQPSTSSGKPFFMYSVIYLVDSGNSFLAVFFPLEPRDVCRNSASTEEYRLVHEKLYNTKDNMSNIANSRISCIN
jgi:hypothetical protein